jgi:hypothetical protein
MQVIHNNDEPFEQDEDNDNIHQLSRSIIINLLTFFPKYLLSLK